MTQTKTALTANSQAFVRLVDVMKHSKLRIAFTGAGVSRQLEFPSWAELLEEFDRELHDLLDSRDAPWGRVTPKYLYQLAQNNDSLWKAQEYKNHLDDQFEEILRSTFNRKLDASQTSLAPAIAELGFNHYLTTNYDPSLEDYLRSRHGEDLKIADWSNRSQIQKFFGEISSSSDDMYYVYLHGRASDAASKLILTESDYVERYIATDETSRRLYALFSFANIVFVGFSMTDPDLIHLLRMAHAHHSGQPRHFVFLALEQTDDEELISRKFIGKYGVQPIFFQRTKDYKHLVQLLKDLKTATELPEDQVESFVASCECGEIDHYRAPKDDPNKNQFGGRWQNLDYELTGEFLPLEGNSQLAPTRKWYRAVLKLRALNGHTLPDRVRFYLHPTFKPKSYADATKNDGTTAEVELWVWGSFTVGVVVNGTPLELDLSLLPGAPNE